MSLGADQCLKGWWSRVSIRHGEGGIHGNPASGHHQRHHHTEPNQWNTYQTRYLPREGGERKRLENKASKMTLLTGQQGSKCKANHEAPPQASRELKGLNYVKPHYKLSLVFLPIHALFGKLHLL